MEPSAFETAVPTTAVAAGDAVDLQRDGGIVGSVDRQAEVELVGDAHVGAGVRLKL